MSPFLKTRHAWVMQITIVMLDRCSCTGWVCVCTHTCTGEEKRRFRANEREEARWRDGKAANRRIRERKWDDKTERETEVWRVPSWGTRVMLQPWASEAHLMDFACRRVRVGERKCGTLLPPVAGQQTWSHTHVFIIIGLLLLVQNSLNQQRVCKETPCPSLTASMFLSLSLYFHIKDDPWHSCEKSKIFPKLFWMPRRLTQLNQNGIKTDKAARLSLHVCKYLLFGSD